MAAAWWLIACLGVAQTPAADAPTAAPVYVGGVSANRAPAEAVAGATQADADEARPITRPDDRIVRRDGAGSGAGVSGSAGGWWGWIRGWWPLALVLGLFAGVAWAGKRWLPRTGMVSHRGMIEVLGRHAIAPRQSVVLVKVGRRVVLLGVTPEHVSSLETIADPDEVAELVGRAAVGRKDSMTDVFQREIVREATAYDPVRAERETIVDMNETRGGQPRDATAGYGVARQQIRTLLQRVRSITGTTSR